MSGISDYQKALERERIAKWLAQKVVEGIAPKKPTPHPFVGKLMGGIVQEIESSSDNSLLTLWEYMQSDHAPAMHYPDARRVWFLFYTDSGQRRVDVPPMHVVRHKKLLKYVQDIIDQANSSDLIAAE